MNATDASRPDLAEATALAFVNGEMMRNLGLDPKVLEVGLMVASQHMQRGNLLEALEAYTSLIILNPLDLEAHIGLATCALRLQIADVALRSASLVIGQAKSDPRGYLLSAQALLLLREPEAAARDAQAALDLTAGSGLDAAIRNQVSSLAARILSTLSAPESTSA